MDQELEEAIARMKNRPASRTQEILDTFEDYDGPEISGDLKPSLLTRFLRWFE